MTKTADHASRLTAEVDALLRPLRDHYEDLTREIREHEDAARELKRVRGQVAALIRVTDPSFGKRPYAANGKGGKQAGGKRGLPKVHPDAVERLHEWLMTNAADLNALEDGKGFYASGLVEARKDLPPGVRYQSALSSALATLHDRGVVTLTYQGGTGGRKYYRVVI